MTLPYEFKHSLALKAICCIPTVCIRFSARRLCGDFSDTFDTDMVQVLVNKSPVCPKSGLVAALRAEGSAPADEQPQAGAEPGDCPASRVPTCAVEGSVPRRTT